jgi:nicotinamide N-methyltransferase
MAESDEEIGDLFQEPADFYQKEKPHTFFDYQLQSGNKLHLRLIGSSPLWVSLLCRVGHRDRIKGFAYTHFK